MNLYGTACGASAWPLKIRKARRCGQAFDTGGGVRGTDTATLFYRFSAAGRTLALRRGGDWKNAALRGHHTALAQIARGNSSHFLSKN